MQFDLDQRTVRLAIGDFATFSTGPRPAADRPSPGRGIWRAQLGTHWHNELRQRTSTNHPDSRFEVPLTGRLARQGWLFLLEGRIDQLLPASPSSPRLVREIKSTLVPLPRPEADLRQDHPDYFLQLGAYLALLALESPSTPTRGELVLVEASSGLTQTILFDHADHALVDARLDQIVAFLDHRRQARDRLRALVWHPPFTSPRPGQESIQSDLANALDQSPRLLLSAPTGFGKTGALLAAALTLLRSGRVSRVLYLTSKSTGQLQVLHTLGTMVPPPTVDAPEGVSVWHVRPKREHCVNHVFHCLRDHCQFLGDLPSRWQQGGLARFHRLVSPSRDLDSLREAGLSALVCPYEITRTSLPFCDVWIGDFNYVFSPANRSLFLDQPGFDPTQTLLVIDEAHNLPSRVADALSHSVNADDARAVLTELEVLRAERPLLRAWEAWTRFLAALQPSEALDFTAEDDVADLLSSLAERLASHPPDFSSLPPFASELLWKIPALHTWLDLPPARRLLWSPRPRELHFTCLDASASIADTLAPYQAVLFATATPGPLPLFAEACGLADTPPRLVHALTPWRDHAYDVACDLRVDTTYRERARHHAVTAATIEALHAAATGAVVVFFPSYAYAETLATELEKRGSTLRLARQPRRSDLAAQRDWIESSLAFSDALFLVLGSGFAEGIDALGGRVSHALVVGPALPEVNAVQRARLDALSSLGRAAAFTRVYQAPGLQKVNQALGRLIRAPGQHTKVLLHCRRFVDPTYARLLDPDYQFGPHLESDADLTAWLNAPHPPPVETPPASAPSPRK